jgi:hypothetical protein
MLHAKDLRFGNRVLNHKDEIITVQQILCNSIVYDTQLNVSREMSNVSSYYGSDYTAHVVEVVKEADLQDVEPIALTESILEKCKFRNFVREEWIIRYGNFHLDFEFTEDGLRLRNPTPSRIAIKYLHQLQNFFYAITGQELEVNL